MSVQYLPVSEIEDSPRYRGGAKGEGGARKVIRRWALRDIKAMRTKCRLVGPE